MRFAEAASLGLVLLAHGAESQSAPLPVCSDTYKAFRYLCGQNSNEAACAASPFGCGFCKAVPEVAYACFGTTCDTPSSCKDPTLHDRCVPMGFPACQAVEGGQFTPGDGFVGIRPSYMGSGSDLACYSYRTYFPSDGCPRLEFADGLTAPPLNNTPAAAPVAQGPRKPPAQPCTRAELLAADECGRNYVEEDCMFANWGFSHRCSWYNLTEGLHGTYNSGSYLNSLGECNYTQISAFESSCELPPSRGVCAHDYIDCEGDQANAISAMCMSWSNPEHTMADGQPCPSKFVPTYLGKNPPEFKFVDMSFPGMGPTDNGIMMNGAESGVRGASLAVLALGPLLLLG